LLKVLHHEVRSRRAEAGSDEAMEAGWGSPLRRRGVWGFCRAAGMAAVGACGPGEGRRRRRRSGAAMGRGGDASAKWRERAGAQGKGSEGAARVVVVVVAVVLAMVVVRAVVVVGRGALVASGAAGSEEVGGTGTRRLDRPRRAVKGSRAAGQQGRGSGKRGRRQGRRQRRQRASVQAACRRAGVQVGRRASVQACKRAGEQGGQAGQGRDCEAARLRRTSGGRGVESRVRLAICSSMMWLIDHPRKTAAPPRRLTADQQQDAIEKQAPWPPWPPWFEAAPGGLQSRSRLGVYSHAQHTTHNTQHTAYRTQHIAYQAHSTHRYGTEPKRVQLRVKQDARCGFALPSKLQRRCELHWART
jgi:hypothetical protein